MMGLKAIKTSRSKGAQTEFRHHSRLKEIWRRFRKNKLALVGLIVIIIIIVIAAAAPYLAPEGYDSQNIPDSLLRPGQKGYVLGTDNLGRDVLSRIIWGAQYTLQCGVIAVLVSAVCGCSLGLVAGYYSGAIDNLIMRLMDILLAIPGILLAICIAATLGPGMRNAIIAVGVSGTPAFARIVRSSVLTVREMEYIEAAHAVNASDARIILTHILPNSLAPILVQTTLSIANAIMQTAALSFLGLGVQLPISEWGAMISGARPFFKNYSYLVTSPGIAIMLLVFSINIFGDGLRDALDPRLRR